MAPGMMWCSVLRECGLCVEALFLCEIVRVAVGAGIFVSIVVSIPACHVCDPGLIPGREALLFALCFSSGLCIVLFSFDAYVSRRFMRITVSKQAEGECLVELDARSG